MLNSVQSTAVRPSSSRSRRFRGVDSSPVSTVDGQEIVTVSPVSTADGQEILAVSPVSTAEGQDIVASESGEHGWRSRDRGPESCEQG